MSVRSAPVRTAAGFALALFVAQAQAADVPKAQADFMAAMADYAAQYDAAPNDLKRTALVKPRADAATKNAPGGKVEKWVGRLDSMGTTKDGQAYVTVKLDKVTAIRTWSNAFSDKGAGTLIPAGSPLYVALADLAQGDVVVFSADLLREGSMSERGSMTRPEFVAKFRSIEKAR